jgi:hypothetical protein
MLRPLRPLRAPSVLLIIAAMVLQGCGGGGGSSATPRVTTTMPPSASATSTPVPAGAATPVAQPAGALLTSGVQGGTLGLPAGSKLSASNLKVSNSLGTVTPDATGAFTLPAFTNGPQLAIAANAAGAPVLAGFLSPSEPSLNAHTTAEYLAYYAGGLFLLDPQVQGQAYATIAVNPAFAALEAAVTADIAANPGTFPATQQAVKAFIGANGGATSSFTRAAATQRRGINDLLVDPGNPQSGVTVLNANQVAINFMNEKRRPALAYIDQVSYGMSSGSTSAIVPAPITDVVPPVNSGFTTGDTAGDLYRIMGKCGDFNNCIPATTSLKTVTGTLTDLLYGNSAFTPVSTGNLTLPTVANSLWTRYQVTVVGPGAHTGIALTDEQFNGQQDVTMVYLFQELFIPLITATLMPNIASIPALAGNINPAQAQAIDSLIKSYISAAPGILVDAKNGDIPGALSLARAAFLGNSAIQSATVATLVGLANVAAPNSAVIEQLAGALSTATFVSDEFLTGLNASATIKDYLAANQGDQFTVIAVPFKVTLTPAKTSLNNDAGVHLVANVPSANGSNLHLSYKWTNTATVGHTADFAQNPDRDNFTSNNQNEVIYTAVHTGIGTDTVTVEVDGLDDSGNKTEKIVLGTATATINVAPNALGNPPTGLAQSRCAGMAISPHDAHVGDVVSGSVSGFDVNNCGGNLTTPPTAPTWTWPVGGVTVQSGCGANSQTCVFKVTRATGVYQTLCLNGSSVQGPWNSCDYYGVLP